MEWVRRWSFTVTFISADRSPWGVKVYNTHLATVEAVRRWRERALANPDVENYRVEPVRDLDGDRPTHCPSGHDYHQGFSTIFGRHDWIVCPCGGHHLFKCDEDGCPTRWTPDPPLAVDCVSFDGV